MRSRLFLRLLATAVLGSGAAAQFTVFPNGLATTAGPTSNGIFTAPPIIINGLGSSRTLQVQIAASQLAGLPPSGTRITGLAFRLANVAGTPASWPPPGGFLFSQFDITISPAINTVATMSTTFSSNNFPTIFGVGPTVVRSGPLLIPAGSFTTGASPNPFGFEIPFAVPFTYVTSNGNDLVFTIRFAAGALSPVPVALDAANQGVFGAALSGISNTATTGAFTTVPVMRLTTTDEFQKNQPTSSLDHNGIQSDGSAPAVATVCTGGPIVASVSSTRVGFPYDIAVAFAPLAPRSDPASTPLPDGQILNVPLGHPSLVFLFSGTPIPAMPAFFPFVAPFPAPLAPVTWCSQAVLFDPGHPSFLSLSQGNQVNVVDAAAAGGTVPGPLSDDSSVTVPLGAPPFCGVPAFTFFGTTYSQIHVSSNGRVTFGGEDTAFSATLATAAAGRPFAGFWTDLTPDFGGTVNVTGSASAVTVNYAGMHYFSETPSISFSIRLESSGQVSIGGLGTILANPLTSTGPAGSPFSPQMLGIGNGNLGGTLVNAPFPFGTAVNGAAGAGLVDVWPGTQATAPNGLGLVRTIQDNQLAFGQGRLDFTPAGGGYQALNH